MGLKAGAARYFVYALCEPDGKAIRYIGVTSNLWKRLLEHYGGKSTKKVMDWIFGLRKNGLIPCVIVLRKANGTEKAILAETREIKRHKSILGDLLLNEYPPPCKGKPGRRALLTFAGKTMSKSAWARELGITKQALDGRLSRHPIEKSLACQKRTGRISENKVTPPVFYNPLDNLEMKVFKTGLSCIERKNRRKLMAEAIGKGELESSVASRFGVTVQTVKNAVKEFRLLTHVSQDDTV